MSSMYVSHKVQKSSLSCFTDCTKKWHGSKGALIHRQQTLYWIFTQTEVSSIYRHKIIVTYWALMKHQALLTIQAKLKLAIIFFFCCHRLAEGQPQPGRKKRPGPNIRNTRAYWARPRLWLLSYWNLKRSAWNCSFSIKEQGSGAWPWKVWPL